MKKNVVFLGALVALVALVISFQPESTWAANGKKLFAKHGCSGCHTKDKGMETKPFPTKQKMASTSYSDFKDCVVKGRPGTAMTAKNLSDGDIKAIYDWLQKYK